MSIEKGGDWGTRARAPADLRVFDDPLEALDAIGAARRANRALPPIGLTSGDLVTTLGGPTCTQLASDVEALNVKVDRRRADRRQPPLVSGPPGGATVMAPRPRGGGRQRSLPRPVEHRTPGSPRRRPARLARDDGNASLRPVGGAEAAHVGLASSAPRHHGTPFQGRAVRVHRGDAGATRWATDRTGSLDQRARRARSGRPLALSRPSSPSASYPRAMDAIRGEFVLTT